MDTRRIALMRSKYEKLFAGRGTYGTPIEPVEYHFYHLARYWSRLVGFCRQVPENIEGLIDSDLGACVVVGSEFANSSIDASSPVHAQWKDYWEKLQSVLHWRPVALIDIERASKSFDDCTTALKYDPWGKPSP